MNNLNEISYKNNCNHNGLKILNLGVNVHFRDAI